MSEEKSPERIASEQEFDKEYPNYIMPVCVFCGQSAPRNPWEHMEMKPCNSPDGDGHLYRNIK